MSPYNPVVSRFPERGVLVAGDLMIDHYLWGSVRRISPEAPVPVVEIDREEYCLGGAANVVNNVRGLGASVWVTGLAGADAAGAMLLSMLDEAATGQGCHILPEGRPTTSKMRVIASRQQIVRVDRELVAEADGDALAAMLAYAKRVLPDVQAVVISDYGKGAVTAALVRELTNLVRLENERRPKPIHVIVDPKGRDYARYRGVDLIKPNLHEAADATGIDTRTEKGLESAGRAILESTQCRSVLVTCGDNGMMLFQNNQPTIRIPTLPRETFEVSGAGDTASAALAVALAADADLVTACRIANAASWVVVGKVGIARVDPNELLDALAEMERA